MQAAMRISRQLARPVRQVAAQAQQARAMSSASVEESIHEMNKWRRGTLRMFIKILTLASDGLPTV